MWALLVGAAKQQKTTVVFLREEGERAGVFERMDRILLLEALGMDLPERIEVA